MIKVCDTKVFNYKLPCRWGSDAFFVPSRRLNLFCLQVPRQHLRSGVRRHRLTFCHFLNLKEAENFALFPVKITLNR